MCVRESQGHTGKKLREAGWWRGSGNQGLPFCTFAWEFSRYHGEERSNLRAMRIIGSLRLAGHFIHCPHSRQVMNR